MKLALVALVVGMLVSGSVNTISKKMGYSTCSTSPIAGDYSSRDACPGFAPNGHQFRKPWTQTLVMFTGEALCILLFFYRRAQAAARTRRRDAALVQGASPYMLADHGGVGPAELSSPAMNFLSPTLARGQKFGGGSEGAGDDNDPKTVASDAAYGNVGWFSPLYCLLPACCDLGGTTVSGIGLLFTSASVFQMLRGSIIFFTAIFSVLFLNRKLYAFHWVGMGLTVVGVTMIGLSSIVGGDDASHGGGSSGHHHHGNSTTSLGMLLLNPVVAMWQAAAAPAPSPAEPGPAPLSPSPYPFSPSPSPHQNAASMVWIGNVLVVVSQLMSATQMVVEEKFLKSKKLPPEFVVGCEGLFGMVMMLAVTLPIVAHLPGQDGEGIHESAIDAAYLFVNSSPLMAMVLSYFVSIAFYNFCGLAVAKRLSSVHRCLIDACRTVLVWSVDLLLHSLSDGKYGEQWHPTGSWIQLGGFVVLIFGCCLYYKVVRLQCFERGYRLDEFGDTREGAFPPAQLAGRVPGVGDEPLMGGYSRAGMVTSSTTEANNGRGYGSGRGYSGRGGGGGGYARRDRNQSYDAPFE